MDRPYEFQTIQTLMGEEVRIDEETGEQYVEQIIIAQDKKLRKTIDLFNVSSYEEFTNDKGAVYSKRCMIEVNGEPVVVAKSYEDIKKIISELNVNSKKSVGFGRSSDKKEKVSS